jgi:hypothetical protein
MSSPLQPCKHTEAGSTIVLVLTGILLISLIAAGLLTSQKSLTSSSQKIEQVEIFQDVTDLCVKNAIRRLKDFSTLPGTAKSAVQIVEAPSRFGSWIGNAVLGRFLFYTQAQLRECSYQYIMSRPIKGSTIGGELTRSRAYLSQQATENVYLIHALVCADANCSGVKTATNIYIGVQ